MLEVILGIITVVLLAIIIGLSEPPSGIYTFERDELDTDPPTHR